MYGVLQTAYAWHGSRSVNSRIMCGDAGTSEKIRRHAASKAILWDVVIRTELTKIENLTSLRPSGEYLLGRLVERGSQYLVSFLLHGQMRYVYVPNLLQLLRVLRRRAWLAGCLLYTSDAADE